MTLNIVDPKELNVDSERLNIVTHSIQQDIENGITNGANILAARKGKIFYLESLGKSDIETGRKTQISDVYFLMSLSKTIAAITILKAIEKGYFTFNTKISCIFPEFGTKGKENIDVYQLLTHQVNLAPDFSPIPGVGMDLNDMHKLAKATANLAPKSMIESEYNYQPMATYSVLGYILELADPQNRSFSEFVDEEIFKPLEMYDTSYGRNSDDSKIVPMVTCYGPQPNKKESFFLNKFNTGTIPAANAYSTIEDVFKLTEMLRNKGKYQETKILSPAMCDFVMNNFTEDKVNTSFMSDIYRLGLDPKKVPGNYTLAGGYIRGTGMHHTPCGLLSSAKSFAGIGGGSTELMFDPEKELSIIYLGHGHTQGLEHLMRMQKINDLIISSLE
ncbi:serine hydrolase domain-containing protein [Staphylococcus gallinarum]|uniref:serine hydrolase domain-containing protein n=1 Tax=Staphylococcus gallinarum TaxID=1293 RepID=UPI001E485B6D|nr:serine hydrolase domain-containing protein [Staphylococcus gallinarum]MCD8870147.1 beta-lactamase family protein [Staphylococcus gallinarum]MCW0985186.1 beta-lactamase family protein [Staphylococcus gallinarum]